MPGSFSKFDAILIALVYQGQIGPCVVPGAPLFSIYPMSKDDDRHINCYAARTNLVKLSKMDKNKERQANKINSNKVGTGFCTYTN